MKTGTLLFRAPPIIALLAMLPSGHGENAPAVSAPDAINVLSSAAGRTFEGRLAPHDSIYFLYGGKAPAAKFQFSFKYRLLDLVPDAKESETRYSAQVAYTQRSLWDIEADSSPFYDTVYSPEFIIESARKPRKEAGKVFSWYGFQAAVKHESNGRSGLESRSINTINFRPVFSFGPDEGWHAVLVPELLAYFSTDAGNDDVANYRGYVQLRGAIAKGTGVALAYTLRGGKEFDHLSYQLDLTVPFRIRWLDLATYFQVQYFDGYGESLLTYNRRTNALRFGFSLVR